MIVVQSKTLAASGIYGEAAKVDEVLYSLKGPKTLFEMTWEEVAEALEETDIVLIPVGSTEQHGPHLPLGNDAMQGRETARRVASKLGQEGITVVVGPTIPFGIAPYHMAFPGTIRLSHSTLKSVIKEVCLSLYHHGFRKIALLLSHGGNFGTMLVAAEELVQETDAQVVVLNWWRALMAQYPQMLKSKRPEGHGGEGETARMLATHPELVEMERARVFYSEKADKMDSFDLHPALGGGVYYPERDLKETTECGSAGNPTLATRETGEKQWEATTDWICRIIKRDLV